MNNIINNVRFLNLINGSGDAKIKTIAERWTKEERKIDNAKIRNPTNFFFDFSKYKKPNVQTQTANVCLIPDIDIVNKPIVINKKRLKIMFGEFLIKYNARHIIKTKAKNAKKTCQGAPKTLLKK